MQTWRRLESALLDVFRNKYFQLPKYNKVAPSRGDMMISLLTGLLVPPPDNAARVFLETIAFVL
jgi:hypothetical protein